MDLSGKRVAIFIEDMYNEFEFWYPYYRMMEAGAKVTVVGTGAKEYHSKIGLPAPGGVAAETVKPEDFDAVIVPGGFAPDRLRRNRAVLDLVRNSFDQGKIVAAICHAGWVLVSARVLKGKKATCVSAIKDDVINAGADYLDQEVVRDGNLITSRRPEDLPAFCREIISALR
ncbi:MAG TPA: type 1 glutamine amidotransferase domain-containing protein [Thermodesulfobacteriota bacterium]|nr:type 1 glutamine amidotransferase domain-containing protein [Thermodesulfobacteriota bacterium]